MKTIITIKKSDYPAPAKAYYRQQSSAKSTTREIALFLTGLLLIPAAVFAQFQIADIFSDNMVLQRDQPVHIWGKGNPGDTVLSGFATEEKSCIIKADSSWSVYFKKQKANAAPQIIYIKNRKETIELKNILIGDVWVCSGQSNMEWPMIKEMHFKEEIKYANQPLIRLYNPAPAGRYVYGVAYTDSLNKRLNTEDFYADADWQQCDSNTVKPMTAVGYYFAKHIVASENVPVGLINLSIGGAPIETFISRDALQNSKQFSVKVKGNWLENNNLPEWVRERAKQNVGNNVNGYGDDLGLNHAYKPGFAYAGGVAPIIAMPIKGILWYQGESNALELPRVEEYRNLLHLMINDYRQKWLPCLPDRQAAAPEGKQPAMPFYWVQLSSIDTAKYPSHYWPQFRDEQRKLLDEVKNGGMAVCSDIGFKNDVHPTNKKTVGERLARWALHYTYKRNIVPSGPLPLHAKYINGNIVITFRYTAEGLRTSDREAVTGFSINGKEETKATIQKNKIIIAAKEKPAFIYYGWQPFTNANLVNSEELPASTFKINVL
ncbi:MAG TPA: sialate O-acetylesterase [Agriterribacter sp.]|uniref:sialate O-acetylesterase n=1 Tax=Agriterribacter sp. TaxID=2821509 RepID=UPI002B9E82D2|nr:sialate O-acetylesterase [Agriterribacter sp.]HRQ18426.1 sialate O-acetylesterase [Agriterribacter sp.]